MFRRIFVTLLQFAILIGKITLILIINNISLKIFLKSIKPKIKINIIEFQQNENIGQTYKMMAALYRLNKVQIVLPPQYLKNHYK